MRRHPNANATPDESAALLTSAMVLALFGILAAIEATGWVMTSTLFINGRRRLRRWSGSPARQEELTMYARAQQP